MELLYIHIKKYKKLENVGFCFSNKYSISFQENTLVIKENENFVKDFFSNKISNLTGIVGENGTGKTTVLNYLNEFLNNGNNHRDEDALFIYSSGDSILYYSKDVITYNKEKFKLQKQTYKQFEEAFSKVTMLMLSNYIDTHNMLSSTTITESLAHHQNYTSNALLLQNATPFGVFSNKKEDKRNFTDHVRKFNVGELQRIVQFTNWVRRNKFELPVTIPKFLNIKLGELVEYYDEEEELKDFTIELFSKLDGEQKRFEAFKLGIIRHLLQAFFYQASYYYQTFGTVEFPLIKNYFTEAFNKVTNRNYTSFNKSILNAFDKCFKDKKLANSQNTISYIIAFLNFLQDFNVKEHNNDTLVSFDFTRNIEAFYKFLDLYSAIDLRHDFLSFEFVHELGGEASYSSGEYSILTTLARINEVVARFKVSPFITMIDEAELALHPNWQRKFLKLLLNFLDVRLNNSQQNTQVIITSHSPFILSDLPNHCVVYLKNVDGKTISTTNLDSKTETFGANIHELFTDSFFMDNELVGEFAKEKIHKLIERLNSKENYNEEEYKIYKKEIDIIGEPFIRYKLFEKLMTGASDKDKDLIIEERENELKMLKKLRNND